MSTISLDAPSDTIINVFTVAPENQQRLRDLLDTATARVMQQLSGFVSSHRHQSQDGTRVVHYAQWESQAAFEAMVPNPDAQRHMAEAALARATASEARAAERLRAILETMADGVGVYDQAGRIVQCNRAYRELFATERLPGLEAMPLVDRAPLFDMRDAATGEPLPLERFPVTHALRGEAHTGPNADIRIRALDGREVEANLSAAPLRDGAGCVVGAVSVIHDVAWRRRLEREREEAHAHELALRELNERKDEFLSVVSHELRTPLTSLQGYLHLLTRRVDALQLDEGAAIPAGLAHNVAQARTALAYSEESIQRLTRLADDLADDARIRDGRLGLRCAPCDLCAIVRAAVDGQRAQEPDRVICLESPGPLASGPAPVFADAERIGQVVSNYLTNALKYSKTERPVAVRLELGGGMHGALARVAVRDEGPGLPPADQACVWERFSHIEGVSVQSGSGVSLGLGLHISKTIVEAHGGRVGVESAVGRGSTFWFVLPLLEDARKPLAEAPAHEGGPSMTSGAPHLRGSGTHHCLPQPGPTRDGW